MNSCVGYRQGMRPDGGAQFLESVMEVGIRCSVGHERG